MFNKKVKVGFNVLCSYIKMLLLTVDIEQILLISHYSFLEELLNLVYYDVPFSNLPL